MPNKAGRTEPDFVTRLLQAPADVDVVACLAEYRVEASDFDERPFEKGHIAAGDMFRLTIREHYVRGPAWRSRDGGSNNRVIGRKQVRPADSCRIAVEQVSNQVVKPVLVCATIRVV